MKQELHTINAIDNGNPAGGHVTGVGLSIVWQNGPLVDPNTGERREPNGCFVETVIEAALNRMNFYQETKFRCRHNALAITKLEEALHWLKARTEERQEQGIEGTHKTTDTSETRFAKNRAFARACGATEEQVQAVEDYHLLVDDGPAVPYATPEEVAEILGINQKIKVEGPGPLTDGHGDGDFDNCSAISEGPDDSE